VIIPLLGSDNNRPLVHDEEFDSTRDEDELKQWNERFSYKNIFSKIFIFLIAHLLRFVLIVGLEIARHRLNK
jgi:hypothetical protein